MLCEEVKGFLVFGSAIRCDVHAVTWKTRTHKPVMRVFGHFEGL